MDLKGGEKMKALKENQVALMVGLVAGGVHLLWSIMIALGLGQVYLDFILGLHMVNNPFVVGPFNLGTTVMLVLVTFVIGYVLGWVFAYLWNRLIKG